MRTIITKIKGKIYSILFWETNLGEYLNKIYDLKIFFKYSFTSNRAKTKQGQNASLTKDYHIVEKGLALPFTRTEFGKERILQLLVKAEKYRSQYGEDNLTIAIKDCLHEYVKFNLEQGVNLDSDYFQKINNFIEQSFTKHAGGTKTVRKKDISSAVNFDFSTFVKTRSSIRDFDSSELNIQNIITAVELAKFTPSVCNRQAWHAHLYTEQNKVLEVLNFQNGHAGFKNAIKGIFVITSDVSMFTKLESNQIFIDGGLFAMNIMLALHHQMIGSCPLNTCLPFVDEIALKKKVGINLNERVIMMIAIGNLKDSYKVAISQKRNLDEIFTHHM